MELYRRATEEEKEGHCCDEYDMLIGPNEFECILTEPEDRNWYRDGREVIDELNKLYALAQQAEELKEKLKEREMQIYRLSKCKSGKEVRQCMDKYFKGK